MKKKTGIALCITGAVLVIIAVAILFVTFAPKDGQSDDDIAVATQEIKTEEETDTTTEYQEESEQETRQEQAASDTDSKLQSSTEQAPHAMNPEVYEWPCGNKRFQDRKEPRQVTEFAEYKEFYEQIAQQFLEYEGKDVDFYTNMNMLHFDECNNEGSVKVSYDKEKLMDLLEKGKVKSISVCNDYIIFHNTFDDNYILYFYDETLTYDDPLPSDKDDLMSHYRMVNIAPHWWWEDLGPGD